MATNSIVENQETAAIAKTVGRPTRIPELDGLRGVAILSVIFFHYTAGETLAARESFAWMVQRTASLGWTGVDLFFVLSGFLIGGILLDVRGSRSYFQTFYLRRFFRIIPIYYLWITAYVALVLVGGTWLESHSFSNRSLGLGSYVYRHYLFLQNLWPIAMPGLKGSWFNALWSLAVEEQFYLFAPLLILFVAPARLAKWLAAIVIGAPLLRLALIHFAPGSPAMPVVLMPCRADSLAIGMLLALGWRMPNVRKWFDTNIAKLYAMLAVLSAGYAALWLWAYHAVDYAMETVGFTCVALFFAVLVVLALVDTRGLLARAMRIGWLREIGRVSYCMYIVHLVVDIVCHYFIRHDIPRFSTPSGAVVTLVAVFATYAVARISWAVLEGPMLQIGRRYKY